MKPILIFTKDKAQIKQLLKFAKDSGIDYHQIANLETGFVESFIRVLKISHERRRRKPKND
jgi:hypothetical protein